MTTADLDDAACSERMRKIREQMEFYLSDSNLRRDRFLRDKIEKSQELGLELELFMNFTNIKSVTTEPSEVKDALAESKVLHVFQEPPDKWFVARQDWRGREDLSQFLSELEGQKDDFDTRTIYCENLPINANQEWLRRLFSRFGKINLISVPRFKNRHIKQFCFIEFEEHSSISKTFDFFKTFNGVLSYEDTELDRLQSIKKFHEEEDGQPDEDGKEKEGPLLPKKIRAGGSKSNKQRTSNQAKNPEVNEPTVTSSVSPNENMIFDLKVMTKVEWKRLRNKYLNLQREMVRELKKQSYFRKPQVDRNENKQANKRLHSEPQTEDKDNEEGEPSGGSTQGKRRKRGREKIRDAIKKSSHIFFD